MQTIQEKLKYLMKEYGVEATACRYAVSEKTLYNIVDGKKPVQIKILNRLYRNLHLDKDKYYFDNIEARNKETHQGIGSIIRRLRNHFGISLDDFAVKTKCSKKQIIQIEKGVVIPHKSTLDLILGALPIPRMDKKIIEDILDSQKVIEKKIKNIKKQYLYGNNNSCHNQIQLQQASSQQTEHLFSGLLSK